LPSFQSDEAASMNKNRLLILVVIVLLAAGGLLWYLLHRHEDCAFSGWRQSVGVDIDVAVGDLDAIKSKVGITDQQTRDFDALLRDFAAKYDTDCMDYTKGRMNQAEYVCRRGKMEKTLDQVRLFLQKVQAAKALADVGAQRDIILRALDDLEGSL